MRIVAGWDGGGAISNKSGPMTKAAL